MGFLSSALGLSGSHRDFFSISVDITFTSLFPEWVTVAVISISTGSLGVCHLTHTSWFLPLGTYTSPELSLPTPGMSKFTRIGLSGVASLPAVTITEVYTSVSTLYV